MRTKIVRTDRTDQPIYLGYQGENNALQIKFNVSGWADAYGDGVYTLTAQRPGETATYNITVEASGNYVVWTVSGYDTEMWGSGYVQLTYTVGQTVAKSVLYATLINQALAAGEAPAPGENEVVVVHMSIVDEAIVTDVTAQEALDAVNAGYWVWVDYSGDIFTPTYYVDGERLEFKALGGNWLVEDVVITATAEGWAIDKSDRDLDVSKPCFIFTKANDVWSCNATPAEVNNAYARLAQTVFLIAVNGSPVLVKITRRLVNMNMRTILIGQSGFVTDDTNLASSLSYCSNLEITAIPDSGFSVSWTTTPLVS